VRWSQYRDVWGYVEGFHCRRGSLLAHFGDRSTPAPSVACCDVCAPREVGVAEPSPVRASGPSPLHAARPLGELDEAIIEVVASARPPVGRTRAVEILRGGRSKVIAEHAYDRLTSYGAFANLRSADVLHRVDQLLDAGTLRSTGGRFPKLRAA
jgi:ATP-dependent DNA helicase RecQ